LCSGSRQHSVAAKLALCSGSWIIFSGSMAALGGCDSAAMWYCGSVAAVELDFSGNVAAVWLPSPTLSDTGPFWSSLWPQSGLDITTLHPGQYSSSHQYSTMLMLAH
jgi:hypothetical protein